MDIEAKSYPSPRISVLICTLNEESNLSYVISRIPGWASEVILVDGHSTDDTVKVARNSAPVSESCISRAKARAMP